jgi:hypothetical protein
MFKFIMTLVVVSAAYYAYSAHSFSEGSVRSWLADHELREIQGKDSVCDDYADEVEITLTGGTQGAREINGGKDEICAYVKKAAAAYTLLQAQVHTSFDDMQIERGGFPWRTAVVKFHEEAQINSSRVSFAVSSDNEVTLKRTFGGMRILKVKSAGQTVRQ